MDNDLTSLKSSGEGGANKLSKSASGHGIYRVCITLRYISRRETNLLTYELIIPVERNAFDVDFNIKSIIQSGYI